VAGYYGYCCIRRYKALGGIMDKKYVYIMYIALVVFFVGGICYKVGSYHSKPPKVYLKATNCNVVNVFNSLKNSGVAITDYQMWQVYNELKVKK